MAYKVCPYCGSNIFSGVIRDVAAFCIDDNGSIEIKKVIEGKREYEIFKCCQCKSNVTNNDIKNTAKCSVCGEMVSEDELNENGVCLACAYIQDNKMSQMEALRQLLKQKASDTAPVQAAKKLKTKAKKAEDEKEAAQEEAEMLTEQATMDMSSEQPVEPPKQRRKPKRKTQQSVELNPEQDEIKALGEEALAAVEAEVNNEQIEQQTEQEALQIIDDSQAPFPDLPDIQSLSQPGITDSVMSDMNMPEGVANMFMDDSADQVF